MASHAQSNALHRGKTLATTAIFGANDTVGGQILLSVSAASLLEGGSKYGHEYL